jgi:hypothetical protein
VALVGRKHDDYYGHDSERAPHSFVVAVLYPFDTAPLEGDSHEKKSTLDHDGEITDDHMLVALDL